MLAESTMPGADFQVPIRGRGLSGRSEAPAMFASEEKEQRQAPAQREMEAAHQIALPQMNVKSEAVERQDGLLQGGRIWVSPREVDETIGWDDEVRAAADAEIEDGFDSELEAEEGRSVDGEDLVEAEDAGREFEREFGPELVPVAASVFDDDFFRTTYVGGRPVAQEEVVAMETALAPAPDVQETWATGREAELGTLTEAAEAGRDARLFAGATAAHAEPEESDELDIPAFLRRSR
jgi:hypothetical protein